jgi:hypothetical protein
MQRNGGRRWGAPPGPFAGSSFGVVTPTTHRLDNLSRRGDRPPRPHTLAQAAAR